VKHLDDSAPGEREAGERTWEVVRAAFEERLPSPRKRDWRPFALAAAAALVLAAAFSPPGNAVFRSLRHAVRGGQKAQTGARLATGAGASARRVGLGNLGRAE
jgi:hypothetical protein